MQSFKRNVMNVYSINLYIAVPHFVRLEAVCFHDSILLHITIICLYIVYYYILIYIFDAISGMDTLHN